MNSMLVRMTTKDGHPLREDVSWNILGVDSGKEILSHPLREDVSWNNECLEVFTELEVILFVRMWVEICMLEVEEENHVGHPLREDVSWNVPLFSLLLPYSCHPLREDVSWNICFSSAFAIEFSVILFVRMWVEISHVSFSLPSFLSSSSWGCELKYVQASCPPEKWLSSSSWGCELKYQLVQNTDKTDSHPLREDVSWNISVRLGAKDVCVVILFVRMWVEIQALRQPP